MRDHRIVPGQAAQQAFRVGVSAAAVGALGLLGLLALTGRITPLAAVFAVVVLFPPYLLVVASALSAWLGLGKDITDLRRVRKPQEAGDRPKN
jgi:hypothetical protein